jgi:hypothetical protein
MTADDLNSFSDSEQWFECRAFRNAMSSVLLPRDRRERASDEVERAHSLVRFTSKPGTGSETPAAVLDVRHGPGRHTIERAQRWYPASVVVLVERDFLMMVRERTLKKPA